MSLVTSSVIARWSDWDRFPGGLPRPRAELDAVEKMLKREGLALIQGCRGVGKSTLLRMVAQARVHGGASHFDLLMLDLEDPLWAPRPTTQVIDNVIKAEIRRPRIILLDNLDQVGTEEDWSDWILSLRRGGMQILATVNGSLTKTMSKDLPRVRLLPMTYGRWLDLFTDKSVKKKSEANLLDFLRAGGLPIGRNNAGRSIALRDLFHRILLLDVLYKKKVRDPNILTAVAVELVRHLGEGVSASSLKGRICRSLDQARMFLDHLQDSGLVYLVPRLADATRESPQSSRLVLLADGGLAPVLGTEDRAALALNAVFVECLRADRSAWHWSAKGRKGLVVDGELFVDVWWPEAGERVELRGLEAVLKDRPEAKGLLLLPDVQDSRHGVIQQRDLGSWLTKPDFMDGDKKPTDKSVKKQNSIASHLL